MSEVNEAHFNSDLRNFRSDEIETLAEYSRQFKESAINNPEMVMYNWPRYVRTNEISRFLTFYETYKKIQEVQGSVFQVGVLEGNTLFSFAHLIENFEPRNYTRKIYAFDTYGDNDYAQVSEIDGQYLNGEVKTIPTVSSFSELEKSVDIFNRSRYFNQFRLIELIKGNAAETVEKLLRENPGLVCSLLNLQISLYEVEKAVLRMVWPIIPIGGIVHFASLGYEGSPSVGKMLDDTLGISNVQIKRYSYATKMSYIVKH